MATFRLRQFAMVSVFCAAVAGCRNDPYLNSHIEILNAEKRALEDQLYELEYDYERKVAELAEAQERLSRMEEGDRGGRTQRSNQTPRVELPGTDDDGLDFRPPEVTPGVPDEPSIELPDSGLEGRSRQRVLETEPVRLGPALLEPEDPRITHLHIDPQQTGGSEFDQRPGDDGILLVVEPRNRNDAFVPLAGPLTVVVLDYARRDAGNQARIAKWELTAQQVDRSLLNNSNQRGIYLRLPFGDVRPESSKLMVAVRYVTADGRKIEATRDIFITLPNQVSQRWTPRSSTEVGDSAPSGGISVARQPDATDGASLLSPAPRDEPETRSIAPVVFEVQAPESPSETSPSAATASPAWRPDR